MFKESLERILDKTDGSLGAMIMGLDGIPVEKVMRPDGLEANLDVAAAEATTLVRSAQRIGQDIGLGDCEELTFSLGGVKLLTRLMNNDYFLVLALRPEGNFGRGRYELRRAELSLAHEFNL